MHTIGNFIAVLIVIALVGFVIYRITRPSAPASPPKTGTGGGGKPRDGGGPIRPV